MIGDLLEHHDFRGWTRREIITLLGEPNATPSDAGYSNWHMAYVVGLERSGAFSLDTEFLIFRLSNDDEVVEYKCVVN